MWTFFFGLVQLLILNLDISLISSLYFSFFFFFDCNLFFYMPVNVVSLLPNFIFFKKKSVLRLIKNYWTITLVYMSRHGFMGIWPTYWLNRFNFLSHDRRLKRLINWVWKPYTIDFTARCPTIDLIFRWVGSDRSPWALLWLNS